MATKEGQRAILRPGVPAPEALEEAHMTSLLDEIGLEPARGGHRGARQGRGGYEGIVQRVDEQRGAADARQELRAARARPVIPLIGKAVERRGDEAIVLGERLGPAGRGQVEEVPVEMAFWSSLAFMVERKFAVYRRRLRPRSSTAAQAARLNGVEMATAAATDAGIRSPSSPSHLRRTLPPSEMPTRPRGACGSRASRRPTMNSRSSVSPEW